MTKFKEHTIWDSQPDYADWQDDLAAEYPDMTEDERYERMLDINADYLEDERANLNVTLGMPILLIADIGRWDGRYSGYGVIRSGNIRDCLRSDLDASGSPLPGGAPRRRQLLFVPRVQRRSHAGADGKPALQNLQRHGDAPGHHAPDQTVGRRDRGSIRLDVKPGSSDPFS